MAPSWYKNPTTSSQRSIPRGITQIIDLGIDLLAILLFSYEIFLESHKPSGLRWFSVEYLVSTTSRIPFGEGCIPPPTLSQGSGPEVARHLGASYIDFLPIWLAFIFYDFCRCHFRSIWVRFSLPTYLPKFNTIHQTSMPRCLPKFTSFLIDTFINFCSQLRPPEHQTSLKFYRRCKYFCKIGLSKFNIDF